MIVRTGLSLVDWNVVALSGLLKKRGLLLGDAGTGAAGLLQVWVATESVSCGIYKGVQERKPKVMILRKLFDIGDSSYKS